MRPLRSSYIALLLLFSQDNPADALGTIRIFQPLILLGKILCKLFSRADTVL